MNGLNSFFGSVVVCVALSLTGCGPRQGHETIAGVTVPVPPTMARLPASMEQVDLGREQQGKQVSFRGNIRREEVIRFYHQVLPATDWESSDQLAAMLGGYVFTRGPQTLTIRVTENSPTTSTLTVLVKNGEFKPDNPNT